MSNTTIQHEPTAAGNHHPPPVGAELPAPAPPPAALTPAPPAGTTIVQEAVALLKQHPLRTLAAGAAAIALLEVEFAVGVLAGIGVTALLATRTGAEVRREALIQGKKIIDMLRSVGAEPPEAAASAAPLE